MTTDSNVAPPGTAKTGTGPSGAPAERAGAGAEAPAAPPAGRAGNIALWVLQVLLAANFAFSASGKLAGMAAMVEMFDTIGWGQWFRYVTGVVELAGAIGLLIPRLAGLAALGLVGVMVGAIVTHLAIGGSFVPALVLAVLAGVVAWGRRGRTAELVAGLR